LSDPDPALAGGASVEDLEDLYENAPCGYLSIGPDARIAKVNRTLAEWLGYSPDALLGKRWHDLMTVGGKIFYETHLSPLLRMHGYFNEVALDLIATDGTKFPVFANAKERRDADGKLVFSRITVFSAGERRRYERDLLDARVAAETARALSEESLRAERETSELREQFIAVLGHDLRNPLASISAGARLIAREPLSERSSNILTLMQGSVVRMAGLIDNVLDFARGRLGGGLSLDLKSVNLAPVLQQVIAELSSGTVDRVIETEIALPDQIVCDQVRIGQLLSNLLGNAITHGSADQAVVVQASADDAVLTISVANGGAGIPEAAMAHLFQPFFRGEVRPSQQGLGLGLHIASEIAKAHGGELKVQSNPEETRFTFEMPLRESSLGVLGA
jgi:sigma-B regulation protein RsbU (phosphoserine phosphatase)